MTVDAWNPAQYEQFAAERRLPFDDLLAMVRPCPGGRVVDLGCGSGELTVEVHAATGAASTFGIDSSAAMLERAHCLGAPGVSFALGDLRDLDGTYDLVFSNAALQWVDGHDQLLRDLTAHVAGGGQLAFQVPANADHVSHLAAAELAAEEPFASALGADPPRDAVLAVRAPEHYAELLYELGYVRQHVRLQVYGHVLPSTASVVEWTKGTTLTRFRARLPDDVYAEFERRYRDLLLARLGEREPYFYAFKRILAWAVRP